MNALNYQHIWGSEDYKMVSALKWCPHCEQCYENCNCRSPEDLIIAYVIDVDGEELTFTESGCVYDINDSYVGSFKPNY